MSTKETEKIVRRAFVQAADQDFSHFENLLHENCVYRSTAGEEAHGRDAVIDFVRQYGEAFSDFELEIGNMVVQGDTAYFEYRQRGTHTGEFWGISPSNNETDILITARVTVENGKIVEQLDNYNALELLKQIDALPEKSRRDVDKISRHISGRRA